MQIRRRSATPGPSSPSTGRLLAVAAAVLWSTSGFFLKSPPIAAMDAASAGPFVACWRALISAAALAIFVRRKDIRWRRGLLPLVISYTAMNVLFVSAMTLTDAGDVIFLQYTAPFWVLVLGALFLHERVQGSNVAALVLALGGVFVIARGAFASEQYLGMLLALGAGVAYAGVIVSLRYLRDESGPWALLLSNAVAGLVLLPFVSAGPYPSASGWGVIAALAIVQMTLPYVLFARGLRSIDAQEAGLITLVEPVLNPLWVLFFWGVAIAGHTWLGGTMILAALLLRYGSQLWGASRAPTTAPPPG